jgi:DNA gyrase/topoisomerase IV subunit B
MTGISRPGTASLARIGDDDLEATERTISDLMGKDAGARYQFIMERAAEADGLDI